VNPYDDLIMDHIKNARNYRALEDFDGRASATNPLCGDEVVIYLKLGGECILDVAFQCTCCGISMASASVMTEIVRGRAVPDARRAVHDFAIGLDYSTRTPAPDGFTADQLALLDTVSRFPTRAGCAMLPWLTLGKAIEAAAKRHTL
jgi:nitrogen fixation protein NifU and related proteins